MGGSGDTWIGVGEVRLINRRRREQTPEFRAKYRVRSGIEATNSILKRVTGAQAAIDEQVVAEVDPFGDVLRLAALVRHAGIVDVVEQAAFDRNIVGTVPQLDRVAEAHPPLTAVTLPAITKAQACK